MGDACQGTLTHTGCKPPSQFASLVVQTVKNPPAMREMWVRSQGWEDPLEEGMATHSSILAWRIPWTEILVGYSPWSRKESDMTEQLSTAQLSLLKHLTLENRTCSPCKEISDLLVCRALFQQCCFWCSIKLILAPNLRVVHCLDALYSLSPWIVSHSLSSLFPL